MSYKYIILQLYNFVYLFITAHAMYLSTDLERCSYSSTELVDHLNLYGGVQYVFELPTW